MGYLKTNAFVIIVLLFRFNHIYLFLISSDVIAQIVDARNVLLFRCEDLEKYVKEIDPEKENLLIINKSDFLSENQRTSWANYFTKNEINFVFYSALETALQTIKEEEEENSDLFERISLKSEAEIDHDSSIDEDKIHSLIEESKNDLDYFHKSIVKNDQNEICVNNSDKPNLPVKDCLLNSNNLLNRTELMDVFRLLKERLNLSKDFITIGLVGYPNVGKSSTINSLMETKKTSVSATPGRTKHFQTLYLTNDIMLCDCPGLVFPAFVSTKSEMVVSGILPIDQMRDHLGPINTVLELIPREIFEDTYNVMIPKPREGEDPKRPPTPEELLNAYGFMRGFMTQRGLPDNPKSSRYVLKDYINGKLLYCHCPPGEIQEEYHPFIFKENRPSQQTTPQLLAAVVSTNFFKR